MRHVFKCFMSRYACLADLLLTSLAALCIGPFKMSVRGTIDALQVFGLSVFHERADRENQTIFDSTNLQMSLSTLITGAGFLPDAMIGALDPNSRCKS